MVATSQGGRFARIPHGPFPVENASRLVGAGGLPVVVAHALARAGVVKREIAGEGGDPLRAWRAWTARAANGAKHHESLACGASGRVRRGAHPQQPGARRAGAEGARGLDGRKLDRSSSRGANRAPGGRPGAGTLPCSLRAGDGAASGGLYSLRWEDVHIARGEPWILVRFGTKAGPTKGGKVRRVPLFGLARDAIFAWSAYVGAGSFFGPSGIVFPAKRGGRRDAKPPADWASWCEKASLTRRVRWHDLRQSCATSLVAGWWGRRWTLDEVCRLLGHSSVTVTERYAHAATDLLASAAREHDGAGHAAPRLAKTKESLTMKNLRSTNSEGERLKLPLRK